MVPPIAKFTIALCTTGFVLVAQDVYRELNQYKKTKPK